MKRFETVFTAYLMEKPAWTEWVSRVNPIAGDAPLEAVNGGRYSASADLVGVGAQYTF